MKNINIRTATFFSKRDNDEGMKSFIDATKYLEEKYLIRTKRVATKLKVYSEEEIVTFSEKIKQIGYWGFSTSFSNPMDSKSVEDARKVISQTENGFVNFNITNKKEALDSNSIFPSTDLILDISKRKEGIDNFRLGFSFGLENETPFFPYAAFKGREGFAIGLEYINLMLEVIEQNKRKSLYDIKKELIREMIRNFEKINELCNKMAEKTGLEFFGMDLSVAPYPYPLENQSVIELLEVLGNIGKSRGDSEFHVGMNGTIFLHTYITSIIKEVIKHSELRVTGFNGIMYSVLEDSRLSKRYANGEIGVSDLLLTSTTCGCGIDMLPITGWEIRKSLSALFFDLYALSFTLAKPLSLRVLPIPNSREGDYTKFRHLFFSNTRLKEDKTGISISNLPSQKDNSIIEL